MSESSTLASNSLASLARSSSGRAKAAARMDSRPVVLEPESCDRRLCAARASELAREASRRRWFAAARAKDCQIRLTVLRGAVIDRCEPVIAVGAPRSPSEATAWNEDLIEDDGASTNPRRGTGRWRPSWTSYLLSMAAEVVAAKDVAAHGLTLPATSCAQCIFAIALML